MNAIDLFSAAVKVIGLPPGLHIVPVVGDTVTVGNGFINTDFSTVV